MARVKKAKRTRSFILTLGLIMLIGYFVITFIGLQAQAKEKRELLAQKTAEQQQLAEENERLEAIVNNPDKSDYIEQVAREKLGYVMQGDTVYYDVTPN